VFSPGGLDGYYQTKNLSLGVPAPVKKIMILLDSIN
jgi:hypothetical protein